MYVPNQNGTVVTNAWQEWDTLSSGAVWGWSHYASTSNRWPDGDTTELRTWADILVAFPHAKINGTPGSSQLVLRAGEPYQSGFTGYVDCVTVGVGASCTTFDFEPSI